jgi:uncharacterized protein (DUF2235 family)
MRQVAERISQLGGRPNFNPDGLLSRSASEYGSADTLIDMIKENLIAERVAVDHYRELIRFFADRDPSDRLQTIRHALSLDDARPTFRPVLWNEVLEDRPYPGKEMARRVLSPQRIQQVWFAGAHANVGGGYPDDGLAFTALGTG